LTRAAAARFASRVGDPSELMLARYRGDMVEVERLRAEGRALDVHEAAAVGDTARLGALLLEDPAQVGAWSADGAQPLHFAAFFGYPEACRLLLEHGADPRIRAQGFNRVAPINAAAASDAKPHEVATEIVELLLEHDADADAAQGGGATALHSAAMTRNGELARLLMEHGADPDRPMDDGRTPRALWPDLPA
jgi:ankyrin repeat protein